MCASREKRAAGLLAVTALAMGLAACGGDDSSTSAGNAASGSGNAAAAAAQKVVEPNETITKIGPTTKIDGTVPKGVKVVYVNCGQPACTTQGDALKDAAGALGWTYEAIQSQPSPEAVQAAFTEAIRRSPDVVVSAGFGRALYARQIDEMNQKKIAVMSITGNEETGQGGITFEPLGPDGASAAMRVLANKTISDLNASGQVGSVMLGGYPIVQKYTEAYEDEIKTKCPDCTVKRLDIQPTDLGKDAAQKIANFMRANPKMKAIYYSYDLMGTGVPAAAKGAGVTNVPLSYSWAPDAPGLQALRTVSARRRC